MITIPAYFSGYRRRKDRSASLSFSTQEITTDELALIDGLVMEEAFGFLLFKPNAIQTSEIPRDDVIEVRKSPSERLRSVLFLVWKQDGSRGDFNEFYRSEMEGFISQAKGWIRP
jgi:hypothetical protein